MVHKKGARSGVLLFSGKRQGPSSGTISVTFRTELLAITSFAVDLSCRENHLSALICNWQKTCLYHKGKKALTTRLFPSTQLVKRNFLVLSGAEKRARKRVFFPVGLERQAVCFYWTLAFHEAFMRGAEEGYVNPSIRQYFWKIVCGVFSLQKYERCQPRSQGVSCYRPLERSRSFIYFLRRSVINAVITLEIRSPPQMFT